MISCYEPRTVKGKVDRQRKIKNIYIKKKSVEKQQRKKKVKMLTFWISIGLTTEASVGQTSCKSRKKDQEAERRRRDIHGNVSVYEEKVLYVVT